MKVQVELTEAEAREYIFQCSGRVDEALRDCLGDSDMACYSSQRKVLDAVKGAVKSVAVSRP